MFPFKNYIDPSLCFFSIHFFRCKVDRSIEWDADTEFIGQRFGFRLYDYSESELPLFVMCGINVCSLDQNFFNNDLHKVWKDLDFLLSEVLFMKLSWRLFVEYIIHRSTVLLMYVFCDIIVWTLLILSRWVTHYCVVGDILSKISLFTNEKTFLQDFL